MLRLLSDENFNGEVLAGLRRKAPHLDVVRVQDVGLMSAGDPAILEWAAENQRILLTHDKKTFSNFAYGRLAGGRPMPGVFVFKNREAVGSIVEMILILDECSTPEEWDERVVVLPF